MARVGRRGRFIIAGVIVLALLFAGWWLLGKRVVAPPPEQQHPSQSENKATTRTIDHIVIIVEENKSAGTISGNRQAPYLNQLIKDGAVATNYSAVTHPSLPNYIALTSGTTAGITNDCNPPGDGCSADVRNIADEIERSGRNWKMYAESMPAPCTTTNAGEYAVKHNPFVYYPNIRNDQKRCNAHVVPYSDITKDLAGADTFPDFAFISPDLCSDMHDCSIKTGDDWLAREVPRILNSPAFTGKNSLLVITWDEGSTFNNQVLTIFLGPAAKSSYQSSAKFTHYSLLKTVESAWGLTPLTENDGSAAAMTDMLR